MNAEILSVGTELLLGNIVNTDARDLAVMLSELGVNVYWQSAVSGIVVVIAISFSSISEILRERKARKVKVG